MLNLYEANGLPFWTEEEIRLRRMVEQHCVAAITQNLKTQNRGFEVVQVEAPLLTPRMLINPNYQEADLFVVDERYCLRPETTMGSYRALTDLLSPYNARKFKLPLVVWQHGKSFRREQDQPTKFMRLKEFYQLEFQIACTEQTANDYSVALIPAVQATLAELLGPCGLEVSDRLPDYAESTMDVLCLRNRMEVCSISKRKDFPGVRILEVAIGTDRCVHCFLQKSVSIAQAQE